VGDEGDEVGDLSSVLSAISLGSGDIVIHSFVLLNSHGTQLMGNTATATGVSPHS
jgi:hypothetical protein